MHTPAIAILIAAMASWIFGSAWYMGLGKQYQAALGINPDQVSNQKPPLVPLLACFLGEILMAWLLYTLIGFLNARSWFDGLMSGLELGLVFTAIPITVINLFQSRKPMLSVIDGIHWVVVAAIEGAILTALLR